MNSWYTMKATLFLDDGSQFTGQLFGAAKSVVGEIGRVAYLLEIRILCAKSFNLWSWISKKNKCFSVPNWHGRLCGVPNGSLLRQAVPRTNLSLGWKLRSSWSNGEGRIRTAGEIRKRSGLACCADNWSVRSGVSFSELMQIWKNVKILFIVSKNTFSSWLL